MSKKYDNVVLIGRFQPVHTAHVALIRRAFELGRKVIIIVGSSDQPRTYKNPWTFGEREFMLMQAIKSNGFVGQYTIAPNTDTIYNDTAWMRRIHEIVSKNSMLAKDGTVGTTCVIGHKKSDTFYLDMFPQWALEEVQLIEPLNATDVRNLYFKKEPNLNFIKLVIPYTTHTFLSDRVDTPEFDQIIREREFVTEYKKQYESLKYPPIFVTADSVVVCAGHVLMIQRRAEPGKGLWAMPGGYVNANTDKSVLAAAIRELREETGIKVPAPVLEGSIVKSKVFDAIDRSPRGRIITQAFLIMLGSESDLPKVKGGDDAAKAKWIPIGNLKSDVCFEDHYEIIQTMIGA